MAEQDTRRGLSVEQTWKETRPFELDEEPEVGETVTLARSGAEKTVQRVWYRDDGRCFVDLNDNLVRRRKHLSEYRIEGTVEYGRLNNGLKAELEIYAPEGTVEAQKMGAEA